MSRNDLMQINQGVAVELNKRFKQSRSALRMAVSFLKDIPEGLLANGSNAARTQIIHLLDRADDHYVSAEKSILERHGKVEDEWRKITQEGR
jgi:hypothetical protein